MAGGNGPLPGVWSGSILAPLLDLLHCLVPYLPCNLADPGPVGGARRVGTHRAAGFWISGRLLRCRLDVLQPRLVLPQLARLQPSRFREAVFRACLEDISELESPLVSDSFSLSKSAMTMHPSSESTLAVSRRPIARPAVHELGHTRIGALQNVSSETALPIGSLRKLLGFGHDHRHTHASLDEYHAYFAAAGAASYASNGRAH